MADNKIVKKVCKCEKCGNEAEMVLTCSLEEVAPEPEREASSPTDHEPRRVKGTGTCAHCGNEADMWVDL